MEEKQAEVNEEQGEVIKHETNPLDQVIEDLRGKVDQLSKDFLRAEQLAAFKKEVMDLIVKQKTTSTVKQTAEQVVKDVDDEYQQRFAKLLKI